VTNAAPRSARCYKLVISRREVTRLTCWRLYVDIPSSGVDTQPRDPQDGPSAPSLGTPLDALPHDDDAAFQQLIDQAARGDQRALRELAARYEPRVRSVAHVLLGRALRPYLDSVDLVQSVHESLLVGLQAGKFDFENQQKMIALALTMVRRKVAAHWRRLQRQQRMSIAGGAADASDLDDLVTTVAAPEPAPGMDLQYREQVEQLCRHLSEGDQHLLSLRLEGYDTGEIAAKLGASEVATRVRLTRLRQRLQASGVLANWL